MMINNCKTIFAYTPINTHSVLAKYLKVYPVKLKISKRRFSKYGDYKKYIDGSEQISINSNLSPFRFLITLIHEFSHLFAYKEYGDNIKPHGIEWKQTYKKLMMPFLNLSIFPEEILYALKKHFINPKASSDSDLNLVMALNNHDLDKKLYVYNIPEGNFFKIYNGRIFKKGPKLRKRYKCEEKFSGKKYLFNPLTEVVL